MIAVIADDLTGAAEIGGIALRYGLRVVMDTRVHDTVDTDVLVIATDARSKRVEEAKALIAAITKDLQALGPQLIFKKTDSLLRGHVGEELLAQMQASGKKKALLVPANPRLKRTIQAGIYHADGVPLHQSDLADAARKRIATSAVLDLVGARFQPFTTVVSKEESFPASGIIIGNTLTEADLDDWAGRVDEHIIPAGSGGFFNAVVKSRVGEKQEIRFDTIAVGKKMIWVCGSAFPLSKANVVQARTNGRCVAYMPETIFCEGVEQDGLIKAWVQEIVAGLQKNGDVIMAVGELNCDSAADVPAKIRQLMAIAIEQAMQQTEVNEIIIEGGATASSIIEQLHYERFFPVQELAQGVIRMKVQEAQGLHLTMKPGSYQWPSSIWK
ncbi:MAG: four-carbon acid sugar kinase family protein [Williamsia sp.]|nr:four-carbon acid sugar kinase family protein [Williamsia sp.]